MKKRFFLAFLVGIITTFNACMPGYVYTVPNRYNENTRPPSPKTNHVWVHGNWIYNRQSKVYRESKGHWSKPRRGRSYQEGYWKNSPRGNQWVRGRWR